MPNPFFKFKQFIIYQDRCAMKVGTDGVLLGAWADVSSAHSVLDIGAGTGLLSIMMAQRSTAMVTGIEIDVQAAQQAKENFALSAWSERLNLVSSSLQEYLLKNCEKYDFIISNPPFFNQSLKSPKESRSLARHTDTLSYDELLNGVNMLLEEKGLFAVILPFSELDSFCKLAEIYRLFPRRVTTIYPTPTSQPKRFMAEFSREMVDCERCSLVIEQEGRHQYSDDYKLLTKDFYLEK